MYFLYNNNETHYLSYSIYHIYIYVHSTLAMKVKLSNPASFTASTLYSPWSRQDVIDTLNERCPVTCGRNVKDFVLWNIVTLDEGKLSTLKVKSNRDGAVKIVRFTKDVIIGLSENTKVHLDLIVKFIEKFY